LTTEPEPEPEPECACNYVYVGLERTGSRAWSYHCPVHGTGTGWYHDKLRNDLNWQRWSYPTPSDLRAAGLTPTRRRRRTDSS